jgi:hypothetical protein
VFALLVAVAGAAPASAISASGPQIAVGATVFAVAPLPAVTAAYTHNGATYTYDAPARLSSSDTVATDARGSPSGPGAASWETPVSVAGDVDAANTAGRAAASSTARVGPGASIENITASEALRIQNAANRIGEPISLVGSRASGTAGAYSDWDYVITGINGSTRHSVSSSLPRGATELGVGRQIDIFTGPLDDTLPHITFFPSGG